MCLLLYCAQRPHNMEYVKALSPCLICKRELTGDCATIHHPVCYENYHIIHAGCIGSGPPYNCAYCNSASEALQLVVVTPQAITSTEVESSGTMETEDNGLDLNTVEHETEMETERRANSDSAGPENDAGSIEISNESRSVSVPKRRRWTRKGPTDSPPCLTCPVCKKTFKDTGCKSKHMRDHHGDKYFKCPMCAHRTLRKENLKKHLKVHEKKGK